MNKKRLTFLLTAIYLIGMLISAFLLFNLEDRLIYDLNVMDLSDAGNADTAFYTVNIFVGLTMIMGLFAIYYTYKNEEANIIYVEKTKEERTEEAKRKGKAEEEKSKLETKNLERFLKATNPGDNKNLNALLNQICKSLEASQGALYLKETKGNMRKVVLNASYAMAIAESEVIEFEFGEGLVGQVAKEQKTIYIDDIPENYIKVVSGLGESQPSHLLVTPIISSNDLIGVVEISSFVSIKQEDISILEQFCQEFGQSLTGKKKKSADKPALVTAETDEPMKQTKTKKKTEDK